jgi:hypothetical protein
LEEDLKEGIIEVVNHYDMMQQRIVLDNDPGGII